MPVYKGKVCEQGILFPPLLAFFPTSDSLPLTATPTEVSVSPLLPFSVPGFPFPASPTHLSVPPPRCLLSFFLLPDLTTPHQLAPHSLSSPPPLSASHQASALIPPLPFLLSPFSRLLLLQFHFFFHLLILLWFYFSHPSSF